MSKVFLLLYFVLLSIVVNGQEQTWSLQRCVTTGLANNRAIQIQQLELVRARKNYQHPLETLLPAVSAGLSHSYNFGSTIDPATNGRVSSDIQYDNFNISANVALINFSNIAESAKNRLAIDLQKATEEVVAYEYKLELLALYFEALYTQELVKIQQEQLQNTGMSLQRVEDEYNLGKRPKSDWYDMQLSYTGELNSYKETEQTLKIQKLQLFQLMNVVLEVDKVQLSDAIEMKLNNVSDAEVNNPILTQSKLQVQLSEKDVTIAKAALLPQIDAFYTFSTFYYKDLNPLAGQTVETFENQINFNKNNQVGLQLTIPVFNGFRNSRGIKMANIQSEERRIEKEMTDIKWKQDIAIEETKVSQYLIMNSGLAETLQYAQKSFETSQAKFESNKIEAITLNAVKNQLLAAQYNVVKNRLQLQYTQLKISLLKKNNF